MMSCVAHFFLVVVIELLARRKQKHAVKLIIALVKAALGAQL